MSKADGTYLKIMARIRKADLIILDDFGLEKLSDISRMACGVLSHNLWVLARLPEADVGEKEFVD